MFTVDQLLQQLRPFLGQRADNLWHSYLLSDPETRAIIKQQLENLHARMVDDYRQEKIVLPPPSTFEQLHGEYPIGMVYYADRPLYPFALQEKELVQHLGIFGRTGSGKSRFVRNLLTHFFPRRPVWVFDWKNSYSDLVRDGIRRYVPGSSIAPFHFNPLDLEGIPPHYHNSYLRQVIELFLDCYLEDLKLLTVQGVEYLLMLAVDQQVKGTPLTFRYLYDWLLKYQGKFRAMDWKTSTLSILYKLITGPLDHVMSSNVSMEELVRQRAIFELAFVGNSKDKSFLIRTILLRLYFYFQQKGYSRAMEYLERG